MRLLPTVSPLSTALELLPRLSGRRLLAGLAGSLVLVAVIARLLDTAQLRSALRSAAGEPAVVILLLAAYALAFWLRAVVWRLLLASSLSTGAAFVIVHVASFANHLLPLKAGEVVRPYLATRHGVSGAAAASTTIVARLLDVAALAAISAVNLRSIDRWSPSGPALLGVAALLLLAGAGVAAVIGRAPDRLPARLARPWQTAQAALRQLSVRRLLAAAPLVTLSWLLEAAVLLGAARFLAIDLPVEAAIAATAVTILFQMVHVTPGGLGLYEASMTSVLTLQGIAPESGLALAVVTHGLKFAYAFTIGLACTVGEAVALVRRRSAGEPRRASRFEIVAARAWNVVNEGKPFTPVFTLVILLLLALPRAGDGAAWLRLLGALLALLPLFLLFWRFDFPLKLRGALWLALLAFSALCRCFALTPALLVVALYLTFTVLVWGTVYYHLRIGTPWTNCLRFWRLVAENPDPTSGNLQEQLPKTLLLVLAAQYLIDRSSWQAVAAVELFTGVLAIGAVLLHQWFFTWVPSLPQPLAQREAAPRPRLSRRLIAIVIDGCRADRLAEAHTPYLDRLCAEGVAYTNVATVYPARTVTCFSSMFTGAPPAVHGMRSNFVPSLGVKCDSVFAALERAGLSGRLVGIAHLIDAFGERVVRSVTAVMHNDAIDDALVARAQRVLDEENPDLLVLQLLSVDQTGHARGSYNDEYLRKIETTDRIIERWLAWCDEHGYLDGATVLVTADHGQGIGIGGHGHMTPPEIVVPCILWGAGVSPGVSVGEPRFVTDIASTICHALGAAEPHDSVGRTLLPAAEPEPDRPLVYIMPAFNEAANLVPVLSRLQQTAPADALVVVVDDGSRDDTASVAAVHGAIVVRHEQNRGLGAALRTGIRQARLLNARAAVYLDADGEYDPAEAARLLAPIERGEADYVLGSRFGGRAAGMTRSRRCANRAFSLLLSLLCGRWLSDGQTGFRAFSRRALDVAEIIHDYNYAQVLTLDLLHKGMRLREVPISYRRRQRGRSFISARYLWRVPAGMLREVLHG